MKVKLLNNFNLKCGMLAQYQFLYGCFWDTIVNRIYNGSHA